MDTMDNFENLHKNSEKIIKKHEKIDFFDQNSKKSVIEALRKKALGYSTKEVIEEYSLDENNEERLLKKKVTKKNIPPDITAVKVLLELFNEQNDVDFKNLTDEELEQKITEITNKLNNIGEQNDSDS